ncbi:MAG: hypothetical protein WCP22_04550 [Chlamydiota bacterium]
MKGLTEIRGMRGIRTLGGGARKGIPRKESSIYLDMFVLRKEKERLEKEIFIFDKKVREDKDKLDDIAKKLERLEKNDAASRKKGERGARSRPESQLKKMSLDY